MTDRILYACQSCGEEVGEGEQNRGGCPHCGGRGLDPIGTVDDEPAPETPAAARARVVAALRNLSGAAAGFVDEFELLHSTQLFGRVTSGEIQSVCREAIALVETDAERDGLDWLPPAKCGLFLTRNEHRNYYQDIADWVDEYTGNWVSESERQRAIDTDEVWEIQWYPDTPVGCYRLAASSVNALRAALHAPPGGEETTDV